MLSLDPACFDPAVIDPATRAANEQIEKLLAGLPPLHEQTPREIRAARERGEGAFGPLVRLPHAETRTIPGPTGAIPLRIFRPVERRAQQGEAERSPRPGSSEGAVRGVYLHLHGGGHALGSEDMMDPALDALANAAGAAVVSVGYRLAPEHPYPAGPDDCEVAALWLAENAPREFGTDRLVIGGESAGAHLAAITLVRLRDRHGAMPFRAANLVYGCYDLSLTPSARNWGERYLVLSTPIIEWFADMWVPDRARRRDPDVSPLYAELRGLPPALFTVGTLDPILDDSLFMAARWAAAGNRAELAVYPGGVHGFNLFPLPLAERANSRCHAFVAAALG